MEFSFFDGARGRTLSAWKFSGFFGAVLFSPIKLGSFTSGFIRNSGELADCRIV
jgi:hypothetical protein